MFNLDFGFAVLGFFVVIGPLIFFHELGHFLAARYFNITVEEFGIGYPPRMVTLFEHNGTKFTLNWIPLGGFMRPSGEDDPNVPGGLANASKTARFSVLFAGPLANMIVAFFMLIIMFMIGAPEQLPGARITLVEPDSPAEEAGLEVNDIIIEVDTIEVTQYSVLTTYVGEHAGEEIILMVERGTQKLELPIVPRLNPPEGQGPTGIRVETITAIRQYSLPEAVVQTGQEIWMLMRAFVEVPAQVIAQAIEPRYLRPVSVVGISQLGGQAIGDSIELNEPWPIIRLTAWISVALAITNLLPIPALDGGRIMFVIIEAVRGKRVDPQREMAIHFIGFAVLMAAMVLFVYLDIVDPLVTP